MNEQFIQRLSIDWNKIEQHSYLRKIGAIKDLEELVFEKPITFLWGKTEVVSQLYWKLLQ